MISLIFLIISVLVLMAQVRFDRNASILSPHVLFQLYFIIQLPLNLLLGSNFYMPRFMVLSPLTPAGTVASLGALIVISQLVFVATVYGFGPRHLRANPSEQRWSQARVNLICAGMFILGYSAFFGLIAMNGGFAEFSATRELWRTSGVGGQGWILFPATTMLSIAMCAVLINNRPLFIGNKGLIWMFMLFCITVLPASNLGFRGFIFLPLLQMAYFYHAQIRRMSTGKIISGAVLTAVSFTLLGVHREIPYNPTFGSYPEYLYDVLFSRPDIAYTVALRSMGADITQIIVSRMDTFGGFKLFLPSLIESITIGMPSALWPDKPLPLSVQFSREVFGINGGVSATVVGEGYWHGGFVGSLVLMAIVGLMHTWFMRLRLKAEFSQTSLLLMLSIYPSLIMMAEAFQGYFNGLVLILAANLIFAKIIR